MTENIEYMFWGKDEEEGRKILNRLQQPKMKELWNNKEDEAWENVEFVK